MAQYNKILAQFTRLNYFETSQLQQHQIDKALDSISYSNTGISQFDRQVSQELWEHTPKQSSKTVYLRDYIHSILEAQRILKEQIGSIEDELKLTKDERRKQQLMGDLYSYSQDHRILTAPFNIEQVRDSAAMQQSRTMYNQSNLQNRMRQSSGIFDQVPSESTKSWSLKIALLLTIVLAIVQLIIMFHKHHFYTIMVYLFIFSIFFLNYFDRSYMKFVLINILLSTVFDFFWLIGMAGAYWNAYAETQHSTIQDGFLKFIVIFVIFCMVGKVVLLLLFFRYRDNSEDLKKTVELFGLKFNLDGKPRGNPIASIITGTRY